MKKLIYILLALAAVVACSKTDVVYDDAQTGEITVSPVASNITKAAISDGVYPEANHISLFAYHNPRHKAEAVTNYLGFSEVYLYNTEYYYTGTPESTKIWSGLRSSYYWPITGSLVFAGYSLPAPATPGTASAPIGTPSYDLQTDELKIINYTQSSNTASTFDLLYFGRTASSFNNRRDGNSIPLEFDHALSWIVIQVKGGAGTPGWAVTDVTLKGVQTTGNFTYLGTAVAPTPKVTWDLTSAKSDMTVYGPASQALTDAFVTIETTPDGLVVIPQTAKKLEVKISYKSPANDDITETVEIDLAEYTTTGWKAGKKYTYQLSFAPQQILVTPQVSTWPNPGEEVSVNAVPAN